MGSDLHRRAVRFRPYTALPEGSTTLSLREAFSVARRHRAAQTPGRVDRRLRCRPDATIGRMSETALTTVVASEVRLPNVVAPPIDAPSMTELFAFMADAELRFETLRMRIVDRTWTARGEETEVSEIWLRHPSKAKVLTRVGSDAPRSPSRIWVSDGVTIRTYETEGDLLRERPVRDRPEGVTRDDLPGFARVYAPRTMLPMETLPETFVHPRGLCRNVLATGGLTLLGTNQRNGRETWLIRCDQPRRAEVLNDKPDRVLEIGVDRLTGLVVLLVERFGETVTRQAEVTDLTLDGAMPDEVFVLHAPESARRLY